VHRSEITIDLGALRRNVERLHRVLGETELEAGRPLVECDAPILATFSCSTSLGATVWEVCART